MSGIHVDPLFCFVVGASIWCGTALWLSAGGVGFFDALFMGVSIVTSTGLSLFDYTGMPPASHIVLFVAMVCGSNILLSALPSVVMLASLNRRLLKKRRESHEVVGTSRIERLKHERTVAILIVISCAVAWGLLLVLVSLALLTRFTFWRALFLGVSCVNNVGLSLTNTDFVEYRGDYLLVVVFSLAMPLGNTLFPIFLRLILLIIKHFTRRTMPTSGPDDWSGWHSAADDLLRNARLLCCHLFNARDLAALVGLWCAITVTEFVMFIPEYHTDVFPPNTTLLEQILLAFFQTVAVRTSGFAILDITQFRAGHLAVWMITMYITAYPVVMSGSERKRRLKGEHGSAVAGRDLIFVYVAVVIILFAQDRRIGTTQLDPSFFLRSCFESVSAYGNVGLSLSRTSGVVSFSSELNVVSQLVIALLMIAGKMRCLPSRFVAGSVDKDDTSDDEFLDELGSPSGSVSDAAGELSSTI